MKLLFIAILLTAFTIPAIPQDNDNPAKENAKNQVRTLLNLVRSGKLKIQPDVQCVNPDIIHKNFKIIPIPPAIKSKSHPELIPPYKEGTRVLKQIKK